MGAQATGRMLNPNLWDWANSALAFLDRGGVIIWILILLSIVAVAIIVMKTQQFMALRGRHLSFVAEVMRHLKDGNDRVALDRLSMSPHPVARVMESVIATQSCPTLSPRDCDAEVSRVGSREIYRLEGLLSPLEIIAVLSPLLGLLGTVIGMISAFSELEQAGSNVDPTVLAGGIWTALLTTAYGLALAIPALAAFSLFESTIAGLGNTMKDAAIGVNGILKTRDIKERDADVDAPIPGKKANTGTKTQTTETNK